MGRTPLERALSAARDTRRLELGPGVLSTAPQIFKELFPTRPMLIVSDEATFEVAGKAVLKYFQSSGQQCFDPFIYQDPKLYAEHAFVLSLEDALRGNEAIPIAVGAGTINDLTKLAASRQGRPYMAVATAASMDGYTAFGASITYKGSKQTFACPAPQAAIADIDVIRNAPAEMTASGYADLLAKITAGADWIIADALDIEPIHADAWGIVQGNLRQAISDPGAIREKNSAAILRLTEGLLLGGFAMQAAQSSRAASGAEHQFSHLWDMQHHTFQGETPSHGFKVGIGTLAVAALYEYLLEHPMGTLEVERCCNAWPDLETIEGTIRELFPPGELAEKAIEETRAKHPDTLKLRSQLQRLIDAWPELKKRLSEQLIAFAELKHMLGAAGAPNEPAQIGISVQRLRKSFYQATYIRRRFTVLDLALRTGLLEPALEFLFGKEGVWPPGTPDF